MKINNYEINVKDNFIHIKNYINVIDINSNKIRIKVKNNTLLIYGCNLIATAMDEYEIVINGCIKSIEFINE